MLNGNKDLFRNPAMDSTLSITTNLREAMFKNPAMDGTVSIPEKNISITTNLREARVNRFMEFLIILQDSHYKKGFYGLGKSEYDKIVKSNFPGELLILHKDHLRERKDIKIDGTIIMKKVYIKLHKENIYVDASKYQEKLIESTISEFMRIIFSLNPKHISLKMSNDNNDSLKAHLNASVNVEGVVAGIGGGNDNSKKGHRDNTWVLNFDDRRQYIDVNIFLDNSKFYYLPNHPEWNDVIRNRLLYGAKDSHYVYNYNDSLEISNEFIAKLQVLDIEFKYDKTKYLNFSLEYNIVYYPLTKCEKCGSEKHCVKECIEGLLEAEKVGLGIYQGMLDKKPQRDRHFIFRVCKCLWPSCF